MLALAQLQQLEAERDPEPLLSALLLWLDACITTDTSAQDAGVVDQPSIAVLQRVFAANTQAGAALRADQRFDTYRDHPLLTAITSG